MIVKIAFALLALTFICSACYYDVEEELYLNTGCATDNVSYQTTIIPILQNNCLSCHSAAANFGNISLEGYDNLRTYIDNGQFLGAIQHQQGFSAMPQNQPKMADCTIEKISVWINAGALNN